jgi:predicted membrane protein
MDFISNIIIDIIITFVFYLGFPVFYKFILKKECTEDQAKKYSLYNCIIVWIVFTIIHIVLGQNIVANILIAIAWYNIDYKILKPKEEKIVKEDDPELANLIKKLENKTDK